MTKRGPVLDLLAQLEVLRHHLPLVALVVRDDGAEEERRPLERCSPRPSAASPAFISENMPQEADRVDVEDRRASPL